MFSGAVSGALGSYFSTVAARQQYDNLALAYVGKPYLIPGPSAYCSFQYKKSTFREELQQETDRWLNGKEGEVHKWK